MRLGKGSSWRQGAASLSGVHSRNQKLLPSLGAPGTSPERVAGVRYCTAAHEVIKRVNFISKCSGEPLEGFELGSDPGLSRASMGLRGEEAGEGAG